MVPTSQFHKKERAIRGLTPTSQYPWWCYTENERTYWERNGLIERLICEFFLRSDYECLREKNESTTLYTDNGQLALYDNSDDDCSDISFLPKMSTAVSMETFATSEIWSTANIRMHHQTWTKEKQSTDCTYTFKYTQLDTHDLTETKKKPFQCPHCPASFS